MFSSMLEDAVREDIEQRALHEANRVMVMEEENRKRAIKKREEEDLAAARRLQQEMEDEEVALKVEAEEKHAAEQEAKAARSRQQDDEKLAAKVAEDWEAEDKKQRRELAEADAAMAKALLQEDADHERLQREEREREEREAQAKEEAKAQEGRDYNAAVRLRRQLSREAAEAKVAMEKRDAAAAKALYENEEKSIKDAYASDHRAAKLIECKLMREAHREQLRERVSERIARELAEDEQTTAKKRLSSLEEKILRIEREANYWRNAKITAEDVQGGICMWAYLPQLQSIDVSVHEAFDVVFVQARRQPFTEGDKEVCRKVRKDNFLYSLDIHLDNDDVALAAKDISYDYRHTDGLLLIYQENIHMRKMDAAEKSGFLSRLKRKLLRQG